MEEKAAPKAAAAKAKTEAKASVREKAAAKAAAAKAKAAGKAAAKVAPKKDTESKASADLAHDEGPEEHEEACPPVELATSVRMIVPYMLNTKQLHKGDELLVFKAASSAAPKRARDVQPINLSDLLKRAKA